MDLRDRILGSMKQVMKEKDAERLSTMRLISAAIKDRDIAARADGNDDGVDETEVMALLVKMTRQRRESARTYEEAGRLDLAEREMAEIKVIEDFLPKQLSADEISLAVETAIANINASSIRDMGRVMSILKSQHIGQMDFGQVGPLVKAKLTT